MVNIKRVGNNSFGFLKRKVNEKRYANRDKIYGEQYRKAFNIKQTHQEKLVAERKEQKQKKFAERKRIIGKVIGLRNSRKKKCRCK